MRRMCRPDQPAARMAHPYREPDRMAADIHVPRLSLRKPDWRVSALEFRRHHQLALTWFSCAHLAAQQQAESWDVQQAKAFLWF